LRKGSESWRGAVRVLSGAQLAGTLNRAGTAPDADVEVPLTGSFSAQLRLRYDVQRQIPSMLGKYLRQAELQAMFRDISISVRLAFGESELIFRAPVVTFRAGPQVKPRDPQDMVDCPELVSYIARLAGEVTAEAETRSRDLDDKAPRQDKQHSLAALIGICRLWLRIGATEKACDQLIEGIEAHRLDDRLSLRGDQALRLLVDDLTQRVQRMPTRKLEDKAAKIAGFLR
jgi:hypothetical protein